ncbi:MAG: hypothetical protein K1000chlam2_01467 [Chlamydiae bacterium]|nr:hypothetical protein [Chlamydiota bacterium]
MKCLCHSGLPHSECCGPYHARKILPESALQLMRSRYSAYAYKHPEYIIATTHPENPFFSKDSAAWTESILQFCKKTEFRGLKILEFVEGDQEAFVTFLAHIFQNGKDVSFQETSRFIKVGDRWLYHSMQ